MQAEVIRRIMSHYVIIDGILQKSSPETTKWIHRASKIVPKGEVEEPVALWGTEKNVDNNPENDV